jgi:hypothetical protein
MGYVAAFILFGGVHRLLPRFWVRVHRSEIMLGVLVVILRPNRVADLGFSARQSEILFLVSLRVLGVRLGLGGTRRPPLRARRE